MNTISLKQSKLHAVFLAISPLALLSACNAQSSSTLSAPRSVASDATGMKLIAAANGIWTSNTGGSLWLNRTPSSENWTAVASDATGTRLVASSSFTGSGGGEIWTSSDSGETWVDQTSSHGPLWATVASDSSGTNLVAITGCGPIACTQDIWTSTDSGETWVKQSAGTGKWSAVASDSSGKKLVVVGQSGIKSSVDGGITWTDRTPPGSGNGWNTVASDASGTHLVAAMDAGDIWTSTDSGATWTASSSATNQVWMSVASDATGTNLVALDTLVDGYNEDVWTSSNGGTSWANVARLDAHANGFWAGVIANADGSKFVAVGAGTVWTN